MIGNPHLIPAQNNSVTAIYILMGQDTSRTKTKQVSEHIWGFGDFLPTAAEIAGMEIPTNTDGISLLPVLTGY